MRRASGNRMSKVGKATIQDSAQAPGHSAKKSGENPRVRSVATAETMQDIINDRMSGRRIGA